MRNQCPLPTVFCYDYILKITYIYTVNVYAEIVQNMPNIYNICEIYANMHNICKMSKIYAINAKYMQRMQNLQNM